MAGRRDIAKTNLISSGLTSVTALKRGHQSPELRPRFQRRGLCFGVGPVPGTVFPVLGGRPELTKLSQVLLPNIQPTDTCMPKLDFPVVTGCDYAPAQAPNRRGAR